MDLDAVADELYGLPPGDFTAARDERAKAARAAGDRKLADRIRRLRRPALAAWAGNLLVREQPDEARRLLQLGEALRQAHRDMDGEQLRELSERQHQITFALARQAGRLAARAGHRISDGTRQEIQDTLHAVLADPRTAEQWAAGRMTKPLSAPAGFPASSGQPAPSADLPRPAPSTAGGAADREEEHARRRDFHQRLGRARQHAADTQREAHEQESELAAAEQEQSRAEEDQQQAEQRITHLTRQLQEADHEQRQAREDARKTRDHARAADRALREARRRARDAAVHARELAEHTRDREREKGQG
ncbi:hypothetical protein [Streptomyces sp. MNU89]|uniref:hypothetical protein n=1 Tax=Streptomyces sp. MNU89 TaxID=2560025 RepID=UPI001E287F3F|nr:hypothetical protein [Streptomyces sp. MNU89]MCC9741568.1 hypothetical protein [Streptomyces sp. MNU89]